MTQPDLQAELGEPSHPCAIWPAEIDGLEMPFELMLPSVASVVRSHLVERLPTERPDTWARVEASDDGQNGGELGSMMPKSELVAKPSHTMPPERSNCKLEHATRLLRAHREPERSRSKPKPDAWSTCADRLERKWW